MAEMPKNLDHITFVCPICKGGLATQEQGLFCTACKKSHPISGGVPQFIELAPQESKRSDDLVFRVKLLFKRYPRIFFILYNLIAIFVGKSAKHFVETLPNDSLIISVGSGVKVVGEKVINIDIAKGESVDVIASVYDLPFKDESVDALVSESLFEHLEFPEKAANEIRRVLKPGGQIYILTPFMLGFHSSPHDFYRWTIPGLELLFRDFTKKEAGVAIGPSSALAALLREWCAMLLSFGSPTVYQIWTMFFMILFIPLNLFDLVIARFSFASNIALAYYFIAEKK